MSDKNQSVDSKAEIQAEGGQETVSGQARPEAVEPVEPVQQPEVNQQAEGGQPDAPSADEDLAAKVQELQAQVAQYHEELLRAHAETENVRRRAQEDVAKARKFGIEAFAESLIPVRDSLEAALAAQEQTLESWREGVEVTLRQLTNAFERNLLKEIAPEPGEKFDPNVHQAISSVPSEYAAGMIVQRLQKGYTISERVLRPALVTVSSGAST